jgi:hypothetical protein
MSERKVLQKYYPPDFDPSALERRRGPKASGPRVQAVRIMAPFSMRCTRCGCFIYKVGFPLVCRSIESLASIRLDY